MFTVPDDVRALRDRVLQFVEQTVYPHEAELERPWAEAVGLVDELRQEAKGQGLWALGHPTDIGGHGLTMRDYLFVNEVIGRSLPAQVILGPIPSRPLCCCASTPPARCATTCSSGWCTAATVSALPSPSPAWRRATRPNCAAGPSWRARNGW